MGKNIGSKLRELGNKIHRQMDKFATKGEFTGSQGRILHFLLGQKEDIYQKDIEIVFGIRPASATELLKKMEKNNLIIREPLSNDKRLKKIIPTIKANKYKGLVEGDIKKLEELLSKNITEEEMKIFKNVLDKMIENLSEK